ncbi:MAG: C25 family cysteine peptidase [Candidatus Sumerlaeota bacterium]|nr:C25 family cysteine peptidase [Candidatus Sumerlaeota bacterium]
MNLPQWIPARAGETKIPPALHALNKDSHRWDYRAAVSGVFAGPIRAANHQTYHRISVPGGGLTGATTTAPVTARAGTAGIVSKDDEGLGSPEIPFKGFWIEVPANAAITLETSEPMETSLGTGFRLAPRQRALPNQGANTAAPFEINAAAFASNNFLPRVHARVAGDVRVRGKRYLFVQLFPIRYNPATTEIRLLSSVRLSLRINADGAATASSQFTVPSSQLTIPGSQLTVQRFQSSATGGASGADYLIITADALYDSVLPLADWKRRMGFITRVVRISDIGASTANIQNYLQQAFSAWNPKPSFVLLAGDQQDIPAYYGGPLPAYTDQVYSCVDGADYFPDLTIGRLPVHTAADCQTVVNKILTYERTPDSGDWYRHFLSAGFFEDTDDDAVEDRWFMEVSAYLTDFLSSHTALTSHTAWCTDSSTHSQYYFCAQDYPHRFYAANSPVPTWVTAQWTPYQTASQAISDTINAGAGFVIHRGHGTETSWEDPPYDNGLIGALNNGVRTPVVFSMNCQTGSFQRVAGDSLCEAFLKKSSGGAVGIVGATRVSFSGYNDLIIHGLFDCFYPSYDPANADGPYPHSWRPAEALSYGKYYMYSYYGPGSYTEGEFNMFHWFGDPEMEIRDAAPAALSVTHPASAYFGEPSTVTVTVLQSGIPLAGARVAISGPRIAGASLQFATQDLFTGLTDTSGTLSFGAAAFGALGMYDVVVTHRSAYPYEGVLQTRLSPRGAITLDRPVYSGSDVIAIHLEDGDLSGAGLASVTLTSSLGDVETAWLTEATSDSGIFSGTIPTTTAALHTGDGRLQVAHGDLIAAIYADAFNGIGPATTSATALADTQPPVISALTAGGIRPISATVSFQTDEPSTAALSLSLGSSESALLIATDPVFATTHSFALNGLTPSTQYYYAVAACDAVGNLANDDNGGTRYAFATPEAADYFTEIFLNADNDLAWSSLTFTPDGSSSFYRACRTAAAGFPVDTSGGLTLTLADDGGGAISLAGGKQAPFYGVAYNGFFVGSNGYVTFGQPDATALESLNAHFGLPRISALFTNLNPAAGGRVSWLQTSDSAVVTFENVPRFGAADSNSFQIELGFDGVVRLTWLGLGATGGLAGLSEGRGTPPDFAASDLSATPGCDDLWLSPHAGFSATGYQGDAFTPSSKVFTLTNDGPTSHAWRAQTEAAWLKADLTSGSLAPGEQTQITMSLDVPSTFSPGVYATSATIHDTDTSASWTRMVGLQVLPTPGEISITDSIEPATDWAAPFGETIVGTSASAQVTISNAHALYDLTISRISLGEFYWEDFGGGQALNWDTAPPGKWQVVAGEFQARATTENLFMQATYAGATWKDCSLRVRVRHEGNDGALAYIVLRASPDFSLSAKGIQGSAYVLPITSDGRFAVYKISTGAVGIVEDFTSSSLLRTGVEYNDILFSIQGADLRVFFNNQLAWSGADGSILDAGRIGLMAFSGAPEAVFYFDNVCVSEPVGDSALQEYVIPNRPVLPATLHPGEALPLSVYYQPPSFGSHLKTLTIESNDRDTPLARVALSGEGIADPLRITPESVATITGPRNGPFAPSPLVIHLSNVGARALTWAAAPDAPWLSVVPTSGTLAPGTSATLEATITSAAGSLAAGTRATTITFLNCLPNTSHVRFVSLSMAPVPSLAVSPVSIQTVVASNTIVSRNLIISNFAGNGDRLEVTASPNDSALSWLQTLPAAPLLVEDGVSTQIIVMLGSSALTPGFYSGAINLTSNDPLQPTTDVMVALQVTLEAFEVAPESALAAQGLRGGPFAPDHANYLIINAGENPTTWTAAPSHDWIAVAPAAGWLPAGETTATQISLAPSALNLPAGLHNGQVRFTNEATSAVVTRAVNLTVKPRPQFIILY